MHFKIIVATRFDINEAFNSSLLLQSTKYWQDLNNVNIDLFFNNKIGLPYIYNHAIKSAEKNSIIIFVHDDVGIYDFYWIERIINKLSTHHLIGIAGNCTRSNYQPSWAFKNINLDWDDHINLSGRVGHGFSNNNFKISNYGKSPADVKLLDGCFFATKINTLIDNNIKFDERFDFHFYDLDLCRQFEEKNLKMTTIDITAIHKSGGKFKTEGWNKNYFLYLDKWKL